MRNAKNITLSIYLKRKNYKNHNLLLSQYLNARPSGYKKKIEQIKKLEENYIQSI